MRWNDTSSATVITRNTYSQIRSTVTATTCVSAKNAESAFSDRRLGTIIPFEASAIVVYLTASKSDAQNEIITFSIIAMAFVIIPCVMRPMVHAKAYRKAFERVHSALMGFDGDHEILKDALTSGEHDINEIYEIDSLWKKLFKPRE